MANEVLFAGGRLDSLSIGAGTPAEVTTAGSFDAVYADASLKLINTDTAIATFVTATSNILAASNVIAADILFVHFEFYLNIAFNNCNANLNFATLYDSSGFPWLALRSNAGLTGYQLCYNSGTGASPTWTALSTTQTPTTATRYAVDIKLTIGSPNSVEFSVNGSSIFLGTFTQASLTTLRNVQFSGIGIAVSGLTTHISQILCTRGISTINAKVKTCRATGAGTNSAWTGAFGNVNEAINLDTTIDTSATAAQKQSYAMGDVTVPGGYAIQSVFHWLRAKNDGVAPANIGSLLRSGVTDFSTGNLSGIGTSFGNIGARYDTDPNTAAAWTQTNWNAAEAGYLSAT